MNPRWSSTAALAAALMSVPAAHAGLGAPAHEPSSFATALADYGPAMASAGGLFAPSCPEPERGVAIFTRVPRLESIRYRPRIRERYSDGGSRGRGFSQIHAGFFDPDGDPPSAAVFGARAGTSIDEHIQLGFGLDLSHRSDRNTVVVREVPLPSGGSAEQRTVLARSSSNLLPMIVFLQVSPGVELPFTPYFGLGGGYEALFLSAEDFRTGEKFDATYGGWGWQVWGGAALPLSGRSRLAAEVFFNNAELERDVDDPSSGATLREIVPMDGVGMRFGLSWGF